MPPVNGGGIDGALLKSRERKLPAFFCASVLFMVRNQLIDQAIGNDAVVTDRTIDVHVTSLRGKLGEAREFVETVRGIGYRLSVVDVR